MIWTAAAAGALILGFLLFKLSVKVFMEPRAKPLSDEDFKKCKKVVAEGKDVFFICNWAMKHRKCPCQPCKLIGQNPQNNQKSG